MNILISNDDGIKAEGIKRLAKALSSVADIYVSAPRTQMSANSHAITLQKPVEVRWVNFPGAKAAMEVAGTPADCVKMGLQLLEEKGIHIDMVYSGINMGSNLGYDTLYSGTVGAAMEGALFDKPSVAVSVDNHNATHFDVACTLAVKSIDYVLKTLPHDIILNINVPDIPAGKIKGVKVCGLGGRYYCDRFQPRGKNGDVEIYELDGEPADFSTASHDYDVAVIYDNYAAITTLQLDTTNYKYLEELKKWDLTF